MFKLIEDRIIKDDAEIKRLKIYESNEYKLRIIQYKNGYISISTGKNFSNINEYVPSIFLNQNDNDFLVDRIEISTSSYGSVNCKSIEKIISGYQIAIKSANEIKNILFQEKLISKFYKED